MESNINWEDIKVWYAPHNGGIFIGEVKNGKSVNISEDMQKTNYLCCLRKATMYRLSKTNNDNRE